jgi:hypothetical protein
MIERMQMKVNPPGYLLYKGTQTKSNVDKKDRSFISDTSAIAQENQPVVKKKFSPAYLQAKRDAKKFEKKYGVPGKSAANRAHELLTPATKKEKLEAFEKTYTDIKKIENKKIQEIKKDIRRKKVDEINQEIQKTLTALESYGIKTTPMNPILAASNERRMQPASEGIDDVAKQKVPASRPLKNRFPSQN